MNRRRAAVLAVTSLVAVLVGCADHANAPAPPAPPAPVVDAAGDAARDAAPDDGGACAIFGSLGAACDACVTAHCCAEYAACFTTAECIDVNDCNATCDEAVGEAGADAGDCPAGCSARYPEAAVRFHAWDSCVTTQCPEQCMR